MNTKRKTVLLVDDDEDLLEQMRVVVEREYMVALAHDGEEAYRMAVEVKPDCIVLDVMMEHMSDGLDTTKKLKEDNATSGIPIIMLTGVNKHYDYRSQVGEGYYPHDRWLDKPVNPQRLLEEIRSVLCKEGV